MNKMKRVKNIAQEISTTLENLASRKETVMGWIEDEKSSLEEDYKKEAEEGHEKGSTWDTKYRIQNIEQYEATAEALDEIMKYLESYKF